MKSEHLHRALIVVIFLGFAMFIAYLRPSSGDVATPGFGGSLWLTRRADLIVQLGLMFVGALGIRALLPGHDEENESDEPLG